MTSIAEAAGQQSQLQSALRAGLENIDRDQTVVFTEYSKYVLPLDGYVFWVATGSTQTVNGSVHYAIDKEQNEDETLGVNTVTFTSEAKIGAFNSVSPSTIWIGSFEGLLFSFSQQGDFYQQADLWHYVGRAVYPALESQLVSSSASLLALQPIVSNSLPVWLAQNSYATVYPSFAVPDNLAPPYVVAHIEPSETRAIQPFPIYQWPGVMDSATLAEILTDQTGMPIYATTQTGIDTITLNSTTGTIVPLFTQAATQLMRDRVKLILYGFNNQLAQQFYSALINYSLNTDAFGFMNSPAVHDEKRTQRELGILAQKKTIEIEASYYLTTAAVIAQRLIQSAACSVTTA